MTGAFLSDALRQQAMAEVRGQMLQDQIAKQVSRQIIGQVAQREISGALQGQLATGRALERAADRTSRREIGKTQLEMQKDLAQRQKTLGLIGAVAAATGTLGAHLAIRDPNNTEGLPDAKMPSNAEMVATRQKLMDQVLPSGKTIGEIKAQEEQLNKDFMEREKLLRNVSNQAREDALMYGGVSDDTGRIMSAPGVTLAPIDPYRNMTDDEFQGLLSQI